MPDGYFSVLGGSPRNVGKGVRTVQVVLMGAREEGRALVLETQVILMPIQQL